MSTSPVSRDALPKTERLRINEIFYSIQGESRPSGFPTVFVRLTGCPLRCTYCDTEYAFYEGDWMGFADIAAQVAGYEAKYVCVTGGEPLAQPNCKGLLKVLCDAGYEVSLETAGAMDIGGIDPRVTVVMDIKTPASGEASRNLLGNLPLLRADDQLKFVICDRKDYDWSVAFLQEHKLLDQCCVLFSPGLGMLEPRELAEWVLADHLPVRFQLQLHKYVWGDEPGH